MLGFCFFSAFWYCHVARPERFLCFQEARLQTILRLGEQESSLKVRNGEMLSATDLRGMERVGPMPEAYEEIDLALRA